MKQRSLSHPGRWLWLLLAVPVIIGLARLRFDVEVLDLLPRDLKVVQGLKLYQESFANARQLIITLSSSDPEQLTTAARSVADALRRQTNGIASVTWEPPWEENPIQAAELAAYLWFNQPPPVFASLTNRFSPGELSAQLSAARDELATSLSPDQIARLSYDPLRLTQLPDNVSSAAPNLGQGQELFSSADGRFRIMFVEARSDLRSYRDCDRWLNAVRTTVSQELSSRGPGAVQVGYTGRPAFVAEVARSMEFDMTFSVIGTAAIIAVLFWFAHKRVKPMLWLLTLLTLILGSTLALGGLVYGTINVVSMGFAAILLGLAVDYAVVHYQEALTHPSLSIPEVRHAIAPSIFWAAVTTITAFLMLNLGGLPGLGQLGTLVGLGVALSACIMIFEFLPPLFPERRQIGLRDAVSHAPRANSSSNRGGKSLVFGVTGVTLTAAILIVVWAGPPRIDPTANALRPRHSQAYTALEQLQAHLGQKREPLWLLIRGQTVSELGNRLDEVQAVVQRAAQEHILAGFTLPTLLWPRPEFQAQNQPTARLLSEQAASLTTNALAAGFNERSLALSQAMLDTWRRAAECQGVFWPTNQMSQWIFDKLSVRTTTNFLALGLLTPEPSPANGLGQLQALAAQLPKQDVWLSGWELLGHAIFDRVQANLWKVLVPMVGLVLLSLWLAFRQGREIMLSVASLVLSGICLLALMRLFHWSWNLLNLMAIPLILGTGVDYGIFMQLALRRYDGDLQMAYQAVGRALLLCGGTAIAGFGSLALSSNAGMASLGQVCAVGIASNMLIAILLLPTWWQATRHALRARKDALAKTA